jgi:hypothetical protein
MKRNNTRILTVTASLVLSLVTGTVLAQTEEQIDRFNRERETFFTQELQLTDSEAKAFWPLYNDFQHRKTRIHEDEKNTHRYTLRNLENLSEEEIIETLEKIRNLETELFHLEQDYYHKKFPEVLPPKKVVKLYWVEWEFRRHLIREIRGHDGKGERGKGPGKPGSGSLAPAPLDPAPMDPAPM